MLCLAYRTKCILFISEMRFPSMRARALAWRTQLSLPRGCHLFSGGGLRLHWNLPYSSKHFACGFHLCPIIIRLIPRLQMLPGILGGDDYLSFASLFCKSDGRFLNLWSSSFPSLSRDLSSACPALSPSFAHRSILCMAAKRDPISYSECFIGLTVSYWAWPVAQGAVVDTSGGRPGAAWVGSSAARSRLRPRRRNRVARRRAAHVPAARGRGSHAHGDGG
jgi:hypothetical protein